VSDQIKLPFEADEPRSEGGSDGKAGVGRRRGGRRAKGGGGGGGKRGAGASAPPEPSPIGVVPLREAARTRYLNYAMSVITARAIPDVRDGLKPVQRRILYAMLHNLKLGPDARYRKSAAVVGEVMAKYHPHGDASIYDAMVRMAQPFSLRIPLVDGHGNFGSLDGDPPAAMRYTEARLRAIALRLLLELKQKTVPMRPNYDGTVEEPVVLPAQFPNLLVNGATGIAVGLATNIPPHNLGELIRACLALIDNPALEAADLCEHVPAPDFPLGGVILTSREELRALYEKGEGPIRVRGEFVVDPESRGERVLITSLPYNVNKAQLIESIAQHILGGKLPQLVDVRDESTEEIRVVLELKRGTPPEIVMAYLFKHTALESTFHVNMTCLIPTDNPEVGRPVKLDLRGILQHFLDFRMEILTKRLEHELELVRRRIHILEGFERIFDELDEAIRIIRASDGKADAARRLIERFFLDDLQADAILETKLYRLARLEIESIRRELAELREEKDRLLGLLGDATLRWRLIREELSEVQSLFADERRTRIGGPDLASDFDPEAYLIEEESVVIVTRDGWIKRQKSFSDVKSIRVREGDGVGWVYPATTRHTVAFFTDLGSAYVLRVDEIPATTGYGEPVQRQFQFADRERVVGVVCFDPRCLPSPPGDEGRPGMGDGAAEVGNGASPSSSAGSADAPADGGAADASAEVSTTGASGPYGVAITRAGKGLRFPLSIHADKSTRSGRRYARLDDSFEGDAVVAVHPVAGDEWMSLVTRKGRALIFPVAELNLLRGAGKGVNAIKLGEDDRVEAASPARNRDEGVHVQTNRGRHLVVNVKTFRVSHRGGRGTEILRRGRITIRPPEPVVISEGRVARPK